MISAIPELHDAALSAILRNGIDGKTKPLGALGRLEALAVQLGCILGTAQPQLLQPQILLRGARVVTVLHVGDEGPQRQQAGVQANVAMVTRQVVCFGH